LNVQQKKIVRSQQTYLSYNPSIRHYTSIMYILRLLVATEYIKTPSFHPIIIKILNPSKSSMCKGAII